MNPTLRTSAVILLGSLALSTTCLAQPRYALTDLGVLPGHAGSQAFGLNDLGDVVGSSFSATVNGEVGFLWHGGALRSLGKLTGGNYSDARSVNALGVVVGDGDTGNFRPQSWVTTPAGLYNFFPNNGGNTHAVRINDSGAICGYYTKSLSGWVSSWHGAIWTPDPKDARKYRQVDLPVLLGPDPKFKGTVALPAAFNQSGQAAGYAANEVIGQHACFWNNDATHSIVDLGSYPGDGSSLANAMNDLGQVAGESHPAFGSRPIVWNNDSAHSPIALPFPGTDNYGSATAINNAGQIVGWTAVSEAGTWNVGPSHTVIWRSGGVFDLASLLDPATGAGWTIESVTALNNAGQICGSGKIGGATHAVLLTPLP